MSALFQLPNLQALDVSNMYGCTERSMKGWKCPPHASPIKSLRFRSRMSSTDSALAEVIIQSCNMLEEVELYGCFDLRKRMGDQEPWFLTLVDSLMQHQQTLKRFAFQSGELGQHTLCQPVLQRIIRHLPKLEFYKGPLCFLLDAHDLAAGNHLSALAMFSTRLHYSVFTCTFLPTGRVNFSWTSRELLRLSCSLNFVI